MGGGWRLPNVNELESMHKSFYRKQKGQFQRYGVYWSNKQECNICPVWCVEFGPMFSDTERKQSYEHCYARPVRDIE